MKIKVKPIHLKKQIAEIKRMQDSNNKAGVKEMKKHIPIDEGDLIDSIEEVKASSKGFNIESSISMDTSSEAVGYWQYVAQGVPSRQVREYFKKGGAQGILSSRDGTQFDMKAREHLEEIYNKK